MGIHEYKDDESELIPKGIFEYMVKKFLYVI